MKTKMIALTLFASTVATVALFPLHQSIGAVTEPVPDPVGIDLVAEQRPRIEVVFALDTTGSMGGLIEAAKEKIWSIASTMASAHGAPEIAMGLVAYRDRGDAYVTKVVDLSSDLDSMYATLMDFQAAGGGDGPESVNQALHDAVHRISWSQDQDTYKVVFLVGDAPPHMDYQDDVKYPRTLEAAQRRGIVVNAIQCGGNRSTTRTWQQIAQVGAGRYFQVEQGGSAIAIATPFDERLAKLSAKLDGTRLYYGTEQEKARKRGKVEAGAKLRASSSVASQARRATFNATRSGEANLLGDGELVDDVASGRVDLDEIAPATLPAPMQAMAPAERQALIAETAERRNELKREIQAIAQERDAYLKEKVDSLGGAEDSLDHKLFEAVREQAATKGLRYDAAAPRY
jgi:uncharacterized protein YegL